MINQWIYKGNPITDIDYTTLTEQGYIGFVYCITAPNGKKYIGKKLWQTTRKLPPLKGKTRRRTKIVETDWRSYWGSGDAIPQLLKEHGESEFHREILHLCKTKGQMGYLELQEQMERRVLLDDDYLNGIIQVKIHRSHVQSLK